MEILVDTGVLLRAFDKSSSEQRPILRAFRLLRLQGHSLVTTHQNIAEFWNVATRPASARGGFEKLGDCPRVSCHPVLAAVRTGIPEGSEPLAGGKRSATSGGNVARGAKGAFTTGQSLSDHWIL
jgi:hypothetical protein